MSKNNKNAKFVRERDQRKRARADGHTIVSTGPNGPKQTTPTHGKKGAWFQKTERPRPWWAGETVKVSG